MRNRKRRPDGLQTADRPRPEGHRHEDHGMKAHAAMAVLKVRAATVRVPKASEQKEPALKGPRRDRPPRSGRPPEAGTAQAKRRPSGEEIRSQVVNPSRAVNHGPQGQAQAAPVPKAKNRSRTVVDRRGSQGVVAGVATVRRAVVVRNGAPGSPGLTERPWRRKTRRAPGSPSRPDAARSEGTPSSPPVSNRRTR